MLVILEPADWPVWLGKDEDDAPALRRLAGDAVLGMWAVGRAVNNLAELLNRIDGPHAHAPRDCLAGGNQA